MESINVKDNKPIHLFFFIISVQIASGILSFPQELSQYVQQDMWLSVIMMGLVTICLVIMICKVSELCPGQDLTKINKSLIGNFGGSVINILLFLYFLAIMTTNIRSYASLVKVIMFSEMNTWLLTGIILLAMWYTLSGGLKTISGLIVFQFFIVVGIGGFFWFSVKWASFDSLLPIMNHTITDFGQSIRNKMSMFGGTEVLLFYYPFLLNPIKSRKWVILGTCFTTTVYIIISIIVVALLNPELIKDLYWPTLYVFELVDVEFFTGLQNLIISSSIFFMLPMTIFILLCSIRCIESILPIRFTKKNGNKWIASIILIIVFLGSNLKQDSLPIGYYDWVIQSLSFYSLIVYIPSLLVCIYVRNMVRKKLGKEN